MGRVIDPYVVIAINQDMKPQSVIVYYFVLIAKMKLKVVIIKGVANELISLYDGCGPCPYFYKRVNWPKIADDSENRQQ